MDALGERLAHLATSGLPLAPQHRALAAAAFVAALADARHAIEGPAK